MDIRIMNFRTDLCERITELVALNKNYVLSCQLAICDAIIRHQEGENCQTEYDGEIKEFFEFLDQVLDGFKDDPIIQDQACQEAMRVVDVVPLLVAAKA